MRYDEDFEKWAQHFQSLDPKRWEHAEKIATHRARRARSEAVFAALQWSVDRIRKISAAAFKPRPAMGKPFGMPTRAA